MSSFFYAFAAWILRKILSLRYRIEVKNLKTLYEAGCHHQGGILFLPNHPAEIDPLILNALLAIPFHPRPLVVEYFYYLRGAHLLMKWVRSLPIPDFEISANTWKVRQIEKSLEVIKTSLQKGDNFLIYPSGHLKTSGSEVIGGNSFVHRILEKCPDVQVVLIRTEGLWGSLFSRAVTGQVPDFWKVLFRGVKIVLKNALFFTPRRKLTIEFSLAPLDFPYRGTRLELNRYLENWYNQYHDETGQLTAKEPLRLISFSRFFREVPSIEKKKRIKRVRNSVEIPDKLRKGVFEELARISGKGAKEIDESMVLSTDIGLDSLDLATLQAFLSEHYDIESLALEKMHTVTDLLELIVGGKPEAAVIDAESKQLYEWPKESFRPAVYYPKGETIQEVFLNGCDRMKKAIACGDDFTKFLSYRQFKRMVMVLALKIEALPDSHIGILLPSCVLTFALILAVLIAGKVPVVLNWTAGVRSLNFGYHLLNLSTIFSMRRFLERLDNLDLGDVEDQIVVFEEFRKKISLWDKLSGMFLARQGASALLKRFQLKRVKSEDPAVILFTSGTETYPKAVPLSHHNLISNQRSALSVVKINREDILLGILPPFHSFGFSVTGLLPLLSGLRVFFSPDPTDSHAMARNCYLRDITLLCCAPSFYRNLFRVAIPQQLKTVRMFVSGAEKASKKLFEEVVNLGEGKLLIEGYGITECSPIVTLSRPEKPPKGVGQPIPGVSLCVIDFETGKRLPDRNQGEICIKSPGVFQGYMGKETSDPFIEIEGEKWYRSGDLGSIDEEGFLFYEGRLKRFAKIGGEMVSLTALEEELTRAARDKGWIPKDEEEPRLVIGVVEKQDHKPTLVLLTTFSVLVQDINATLRSLGFGRIAKIKEVKHVSEIPMTGTGKVHFRRIDEILRGPT